ncbi:oligogalacturonate lyase family protein [Candidatus Dactylopiibacterium carminicum]|uniref:oligogalacturonate lyase family protein n=1 Tax=Candidatus Dactylopiibacterium carminicum TaxID=857335 RepID=UPI001CC32FDB|nr:oligogalacturonate lyase family protein [Candidatus Dactylopiibacterium carminicum]
MAKGSLRQFEYRVFRDPDTGSRVTRLTPPEVACPRNYFYQKCFTADGSHLMFGAEFDGDFNLWLLELAWLGYLGAELRLYQARCHRDLGDRRGGDRQRLGALSPAI